MEPDARCQKAIETFREFLERWNERDWRGSIARMIDDASIVGVTGEIRCGRSSIGEAYAGYLPTLGPEEILTNIDVFSVREVGPDVVVLDTRLEFNGRRLCGTMILVEREDEWWISDWRAFILIDPPTGQ